MRNTDKNNFINQQFNKAKVDGIEFYAVHYKKDGTSIPVEVRSRGIEINNENFILSIVRDLSNKIKEEEELRLLAAIVENSQDAIIGKTLEGVITSWNLGAEKLYGYTKDEVINKHISLIIPQEKSEDFNRIVNSLKNGGKVESYETIRKRKDDKLVEVSITVSPIYDLNGNLVGASSIARDITEARQKDRELKEKYEELSAVYEELTATEEELRNNYRELEEAKEAADNANLAKSQFLANMSHEIRTPMNGITGVVYLLGLTQLDDTQKEYVDILEHSSGVLLDVINSILDISKIEAGKFELNMKPFNLKKTLDRTIKELSIACDTKRLDVSYYIDPFIQFDIIGDELRLNQVLINLINNAVKFTEKGKITFKVKKISHINEKIYLQFSIQDTGIGIKEDFKNDIFKKFVQQDMSYTKRYYGTGLGLAISKELVKMMGGNIWFESEFGSGSTFYFTVEFLLDFNKFNYHSSKNLNSLEIASSRNKRILVVEDNEINMKIACGMIKELGYEVLCAYNGRQALQLLQGESVDLIFMDIQMPELNGYETTKTIRKKEISKQEHIPIVAMTAYAMVGDREMCIDNGMDDYIAKPFNINDLRNVMKKYL